MGGRGAHHGVVGHAEQGERNDNSKENEECTDNIFFFHQQESQVDETRREETYSEAPAGCQNPFVLLIQT